MLGVLIAIWLVVGFIAYIVYAFTESETPGIFEAIFFTILGPLLIIWVLVSSLSETKAASPSWTGTPTNYDPNVSDRTKYRELEGQLLAEMSDLKAQSKLPSKTIIARVQGLGDRARKPELEEAVNFDTTLDILCWGIESIDAVYTGKDTAMGKKRKIAITGYLEKVCKQAGREVPQFGAKKTTKMKSTVKAKTEPKKTRAKKTSSKKRSKKSSGITKKVKGSAESSSVKTKTDEKIPTGGKVKKVTEKSPSTNGPTIEVGEHVHYLDNPVTWAYFFAKKTNFMLESASRRLYVKRGRGYVRKPGVDLNSQWLKRDYFPYAIKIFRKFLMLAESSGMINALNNSIYTPGYVNSMRNLSSNFEKAIPDEFSNSLKLLGLTKRTTFKLLHKKYDDIHKNADNIDNQISVNQAYRAIHEFLCQESWSSLVTPTLSAEQFTYGIHLALIDIYIDDWAVGEAYKSVMAFQQKNFWGIDIPYGGDAHQEYRPLRERLEKLIKQLVKAKRIDDAKQIFELAKDIEKQREDRGGVIFTDPDNPLSHWKSGLEKFIDGAKKPKLVMNHPRQAKNALKLGLITQKKFTDRVAKLAVNEEQAREFAQTVPEDAEVEKLQALNFSNATFEKKLIDSTKCEPAFDVKKNGRKALVDQIIRCAMLAAVGDGKLAREELSDLEMGLRGNINRWIDMREAVEYYEKEGDLNGALEIFPTDTPTHHNMTDDIALFGGVPPWLSELLEQIDSIEDIDELITIGQREAQKITDPYLQKIACFAGRYLCEADGEFSEGEKTMLLMMSTAWESNLLAVDHWAKRYLIPVANGEITETMDDTAPKSIEELVKTAIEAAVQEKVEEGAEVDDALSGILEAFGQTQHVGDVSDTEPDTGLDFSDIKDTTVRKMFKAVEDENEQVLVEMLEAGADVNVLGAVSDVPGFSPLFLAAYLGHVGAGRILIDHGADIEIRNEAFEPPATPLIVSLGGKHEDFTKLLIESGANINPHQSEEVQDSTLTLAAQYHLIDSVQLLIKNGIEVNWKNATGMTPIKKACMAPETKNGIQIVRLLLENGADPMVHDDEGWYPIHNAIYLGGSRTVECLLEHGVPIDLEFAEGSEESGSLLYWACRHGHPELIQQIINRLEDDQWADEREPAFMIMNEKGVPDIGDGLLIAATIFAGVQRGESTEDIEEIVTLLLNAGVKPDLHGVCHSFFVPGLADKIIQSCKDNLAEVLSENPILVFITTVGLSKVTDGWTQYTADEEDVWRGAIESMKNAGLSVPSALEKINGDNLEDHDEDEDDDDDVLFAINSDMETGEEEEKYPVEASQNSFLQASICIYLAAAGDGYINDEEVDGLISVTGSLAELYAIPNGLDPVGISVQAQQIVDGEFAEYEPIPMHLILNYAKKSARKITDPYLQKAVALFGLVAADNDDDLDENELAVLNTYLEVWGIDWDDVRELEGEF